jgi:hypothetical protein
MDYNRFLDHYFEDITGQNWTMEKLIALSDLVNDKSPRHSIINACIRINGGFSSNEFPFIMSFLKRENFPSLYEPLREYLHNFLFRAKEQQRAKHLPSLSLNFLARKYLEHYRLLDMFEPMFPCTRSTRSMDSMEEHFRLYNLQF